MGENISSYVKVKEVGGAEDYEDSTGCWFTCYCWVENTEEF